MTDFAHSVVTEMETGEEPLGPEPEETYNPKELLERIANAYETQI